MSATENATSNIASMLAKIGQRAKAASSQLSTLRPDIKNRALLAIADAFEAQAADIMAENSKDMEAGRARGLTAAMLDRLLLDEKRIRGMATGLRQVAQLDDPVGTITDMKTRPNGLKIGRMSVPFGVIGIIYESRPNVTADAGALCIKSGNATILRGGSEAFHSNVILARIMDDAGREAGLPEGAVQLIPTTDRAAVVELLSMKDTVDLIIPRGGRSLIELVMEHSTIPVIKHYDGNCFAYVDASADLDMAEAIVVNGKTHRIGVCNALESLLVHESVAAEFVPRIVAALRTKGVEVRGDDKVVKLVSDVLPATDEDFRTEYLDLIISAGVVDSLESAIAFINSHSSHHTEAIVTRDHDSAMRFIAAVDSACVHVNASTRFSDGGEYGMGCEIGISTDKLHARGPMGLQELCTYKFVVFGEGQVRS